MLGTVAGLLRAPGKIYPFLRHVFINSLGLWIGRSFGALRALLGFCLVPLSSRPHVDHPELLLSKP